MKLITTFALGGRVRVPPPLEKPLKVKGPACSSKVAVLLPASHFKNLSWPDAALAACAEAPVSAGGGGGGGGWVVAGGGGGRGGGFLGGAGGGFRPRPLP